MGNHTPGPWKIADEGDDVVTAYEDTDGSILVIAEKCGPDANLVAAAPELLEALEEIISDFDSGNMRHVRESITDLGRPAVAKAKGENNV